MNSDEKKILRVKVDGFWEPEDFIDTFKGIESFYYKSAIWGSVSDSYRYRYLMIDRYPFYSPIEDSKKRINDEIISEARILVKPAQRIIVDRIEYGSPGSIDFLGLGKLLEVFLNAIGSTVKYFGEKDLRKEQARQSAIQTEIMKDNLRTIRRDNVDKTLDIIRKMYNLDRDHPGWHEEFEDRLRLLLAIDLEKIDRVIAERKITGAEMTDRDPPRDKEAA